MLLFFSEISQKSLAAGALPQTPQRELTTFPRLAWDVRFCDIHLGSANQNPGEMLGIHRLKISTTRYMPLPENDLYVETTTNFIPGTAFFLIRALAILRYHRYANMMLASIHVQVL